jgi:hypothetical protein
MEPRHNPISVMDQGHDPSGAVMASAQPGLG